jgi:hypothetical protein
MMTQERPTIVSGAISSVAGLGMDEAWLKGWLAEDPTRLGLGALQTADKEPAQDEDGNPAFLAADDDSYFSVDVQLGEMDASHGFQVLDNWARNRVRHPDKTHVAVLVTETAGDRYRTTLEALTEHLPLVVVELQVWRGETEAILVPRVVISSDDLEFKPVPAASTPPVAASTTDSEASGHSVEDTSAADPETVVADEADKTVSVAGSDEGESVAAPEEAVADELTDPDTGVADPWKLPKAASEAPVGTENGSNAASVTSGA